MDRISMFVINLLIVIGITNNAFTAADIENLDTHPNLKLLPDDCGLIKEESKLLDTERKGVTGPNELSFMALLQYEKEKPFFGCTGTLINENYVLTAGHCIRNSLFSVRLGEHNVETDLDCKEKGEDCNDPLQDIPVDGTKVHEKFNQQQKANNIGLIRLSKPANLKKNNVKPICLPTTSELRNTVLDKGILSAWGVSPRSSLYQTILDVNTERKRCEGFYLKSFDVNVTDGIICAIGKNNLNSCRGDSGAPLFKKLKVGEIRKYIQFGIVSAGPITEIECEDNAKETGGSLYTNISKQVEWILNNLRP